jgi:hypothetical protein
MASSFDGKSIYVGTNVGEVHLYTDGKKSKAEPLFSHSLPTPVPNIYVTIDGHVLIGGKFNAVLWKKTNEQ